MSYYYLYCMHSQNQAILSRGHERGVYCNSVPSSKERKQSGYPAREQWPNKPGHIHMGAEKNLDLLSLLPAAILPPTFFFVYNQILLNKQPHIKSLGSQVWGPEAGCHSRHGALTKAILMASSYSFVRMLTKAEARSSRMRGFLNCKMKASRWFFSSLAQTTLGFLPCSRLCDAVPHSPPGFRANISSEPSRGEGRPPPSSGSPLPEIF